MGENAPGLNNIWGGIITLALVIAIFLFIRSQQSKG